MKIPRWYLILLFAAGAVGGLLHQGNQTIAAPAATPAGPGCPLPAVEFLGNGPGWFYAGQSPTALAFVGIPDPDNPDPRHGNPLQVLGNYPVWAIDTLQPPTQTVNLTIQGPYPTGYYKAFPEFPAGHRVNLVLMGSAAGSIRLYDGATGDQFYHGDLPPVLPVTITTTQLTRLALHFETAQGFMPLQFCVEPVFTPTGQDGPPLVVITPGGSIPGTIPPATSTPTPTTTGSPTPTLTPTETLPPRLWLPGVESRP